jgi:hypothetical protein
MRAILVGVVFLSCGAPGAGGGFPDDLPDATAQALDGGNHPVDAGFSCTPGEVFCSGSYAWRCTLTGRDAALASLCRRQTPTAEQGTCSTRAACTGEPLSIAIGEPLVCCF